MFLVEVNSAWSPDGQRIAFNSARDKFYDAYVVNEDGSNHIRLNAVDPAWSPDGRRIVCSAKTPSLFFEEKDSPFVDKNFPSFLDKTLSFCPQITPSLFEKKHSRFVDK